MGRTCVVCGELFGCIRGDVKYTCSQCRIQQGCGIRHFFTTTRFTREVCPDCAGNLERLQRAYTALHPSAVERVLSLH